MKFSGVRDSARRHRLYLKFENRFSEYVRSKFRKLEIPVFTINRPHYGVIGQMKTTA